MVLEKIETKKLEDLYFRLIETKPLSGLSGVQFSHLSQEPKKGNASSYIIPFLLKIFALEETNLTRSISNCVVELDNLALTIDSIIDSKDRQLTASLLIEQFDGLKNKAVNCFNSLAGAPGLDKLIASTLDHINISFKFNTSERHLIYNFEKGVSFSGCTTFYLLPLVKYLSSLSESSVEVKYLFVLTANYIQILDDFIDVFDDIDSSIATPITERLLKIKQDTSVFHGKYSPFEVLVYDVKHKLEEYLNSIEREISMIRGNTTGKDILLDWYKFHLQWASITVPVDNNRLEQSEYLQKIRDITPPIVCYTG